MPNSDPQQEFTEAQRNDLASEPTTPKAKGFNFKIIIAILMALALIIFLVLQFNVLGKKEKTLEEIDKEKNAATETATSQAMQGVDSVNRLPASYQNPNALLNNGTQSNATQSGPLSNQELAAAQQKAAQNPNGQANPYNNNQQPYNQNNQVAQPSLPAPSPEQQAIFEDKRRKQVKDETLVQQRETEERERIKAITNERYKAFTSSIKFNSQGKSTTAGNQNSPNGTKALAAPNMPNFQMPNTGTGVADANKQKDKQAYLDAERNKPTYLKTNMSYPVSPYQIMAGAIIPASFITGLNSDLPGQIIGQVRENVYDSVRGRHLLIPQSTRIIGEYSSGVTFGQDRVLIVWTRLIFPNGNSISLEGMPGVDLSGYAGSADKVNNHFFKIATGAILSSIMGAGIKIAAGNQNEGQASFSQLAASGTAQTMGQAADKLLSKMVDQQPTIEIRPGTKFNVFVNKDIILRPYR